MFQFESSVPFCEPSSGLDLRFYYCGTLECDQERLLGPALWDHWRLHFIQGGRGVLNAGGQARELRAGHCFLIAPQVLTSYQPVPGTAWQYYWVAFDGLNAQAYLRRMGLSAEQPVAEVPDMDEAIAAFERMFAASRMQKSGDLRLLAELYQLFARLMDAAGAPARLPAARTNTIYVTKAIEWFELNYSRDIAIADLVRFIGLNPKYFARVFKEETGMSPQAFLINLRLNKAGDLLLNRGLSVGEVARSVGYRDQLLFSRMFKKLKGVSPAAWRLRDLGPAA
jgi:AraC-like DNA-binding protein